MFLCFRKEVEKIVLILPIEKEIETEHRVLGKFTAREVMCGGGIIASVVIFYLILKDLFWVIICILPFLIIFGLIGWYKKNDLYMEDFAWKRLQVKYYKNDVRKYKTKNFYFGLFNRAYAKVQDVEL